MRTREELDQFKADRGKVVLGFCLSLSLKIITKYRNIDREGCRRNRVGSIVETVWVDSETLENTT